MKSPDNLRHVCPTSSAPRFHLSATACLLLTFAAGCEDEPPPKPTIQDIKIAEPPKVEEKAPEPIVDDSAIVVSLEGTVEIRRGDAPSWESAKVGDKIAANDALRTADASTVQMQIGEAKILVREKSDLKVKKISKGQLRARVATGHIEANVKEGSGASVEMEADGTDTVVTTTGGEFAMTNDGAGIVAVATKSGVASLTVKGKETVLKAGEQSNIVDDKLSRAAVRELLLAVNWPGQRETNKTVVPVEGRAPVGSRVVIQGKLIRVDKRGRFKAKVPLKQGKQKVAVRVTDVRGQTREESAEFFVDRKNFLKAEKSDWGSSN